MLPKVLKSKLRKLLLMDKNCVFCKTRDEFFMSWIALRDIAAVEVLSA
jgi:hypothetical protein